MDAQRADFGNIQLYDDRTGTLAIVAHRGFSQAFLDYFATVDARDTSACGQALRSSARIIIEDVTTEASYAPHRAIAAAAGYRAVQSTPCSTPAPARRSGCSRPTFAVATGHRTGISL